MSGDDVGGMLRALSEQVDARIAALENDPATSSLSMKNWLTSTIIESTYGRAKVASKGEGVRSVSREELTEWLTATETPVEASARKKE